MFAGSVQGIFLQELGLTHALLGKEAMGSDEPDVEDLQILLGELRPRIMPGILRLEVFHELY
jgi:hypothetical protein